MSSPILVSVKFDYLFLEHMKAIEACYDFCYPEGHLNSARVHPSLLKIGRISDNLSKILSYMVVELSDSEKVENPLIRYAIDVSEAITKQKKSAYPENSFNPGSAHLVLSKIKMIINGFANAYPLMSYVIRDKKAFNRPSIDLTYLFKPINFTNSYNYAYPENNGQRLYKSSYCHGAFQMLFGDNLSFLIFLDSLELNDLPDSLRNSIEVTQSSFKAGHQLLLDSYPNFELDLENGHKNLGSYISLCYKTKEIFLAKIKMYQDITQISESPKLDLEPILSISPNVDINSNTNENSTPEELTPRSKLAQKVSGLL